MKFPRLVFALATASLATAAICLPVVHAHDSAAHEKKKPGPNGGRLITKVTPNVEVLVLPDRKVKLTFVDAAGKPIAPGGQSATLTGGDRMNPTKLLFEVHDGALVSDQPLPAGDNVPVVLQLKMTADGPAVTEKFGANLATCPECQLKEYACICGH